MKRFPFMLHETTRMAGESGLGKMYELSFTMEIDGNSTYENHHDF
jgi:hypothetical protein